MEKELLFMFTFLIPKECEWLESEVAGEFLFFILLFSRGECLTCDTYVRHVQSMVPGAAALLGLLSVVVFFESIFVCKRRGEDKSVLCSYTNICVLCMCVTAPALDRLWDYEKRPFEYVRNFSLSGHSSRIVKYLRFGFSGFAEQIYSKLL